jgi:hypothetical protein
MKYRFTDGSQTLHARLEHGLNRQRATLLDAKGSSLTDVLFGLWACGE